MRECELDYIKELEGDRLDLLLKVGQLEKAGNALSNRLTDVLDGIVDESALEDAVSKWHKAKGEEE